MAMSRGYNAASRRAGQWTACMILWALTGLSWVTEVRKRMR
jgi:hypothetical protein